MTACGYKQKKIHSYVLISEKTIFIFYWVTKSILPAVYQYSHIKAAFIADKALKVGHGS